LTKNTQIEILSLDSPLQRADSLDSSSYSELSLLLENNEVSIHNQIGLERWLAKGAKTWARLFSKNHVGSLVDSSDENDDNTNFTTHSTPEEKRTIWEMPEVMATGSTPTTQ